MHTTPHTSNGRTRPTGDTHGARGSNSGVTPEAFPSAVHRRRLTLSLNPNRVVIEDTHAVVVVPVVVVVLVSAAEACFVPVATVML